MSVNEELNLDGMESGAKREVKRFKITDGSHIYRILPPFGTDHNRKASRQIQLHWGFSKSDGKTSPLPCSYPYEGSCPICNKVKDLLDSAEEAKTDDNVDLQKELEGQANEIKVRRSYLLNASNKDGEVGVLEITKTAHDGLVELMREYINKYGKNPTSLKDGVWFVFSRSGKGFNTEHKVAINRTMVVVDGEELEKVDRTPLSMNIQENYETLAYDIHAMYKPVKSSDLNRILNGEAIDTVLWPENKKKASQQHEETEEVAVKETKKEVAKEATKEVAKEVKKAAPSKEEAPKAAPSEEEEDWMKALNS